MTSGPAVDADAAAAVLRGGGIVAHPTEAVWGLGCDPGNEAATLRLLALKQRGVDKGLILVAGSVGQLARYIAWDLLPAARRDVVIAHWPGPHTWILPATPAVPAWIRGAHDGVAARVSAHLPVAGLCAAFGGAVVSTSANRSGAPPPHTRDALDMAILAGVDAVLEGATGGLANPTAIRDARTGRVLR